MNERLELVSVTHSYLAQKARPTRRRHVVLLFGLAWTVFVGLALWWLLRGDSGPSVYIIHDGTSAPHATFEKFRAWSKADLGVQRVYPWVLLGPYVALIASFFPLERGRLRLSLALNLAACVGFVAASHAISARTSAKSATVLFIRSQGTFDARVNRGTTNVLQVEINGVGTQSGASEGRVRGGTGQGGLISDSQQLVPPDRGGVSDVMAERFRDVSDAGLSNLLVQARMGLNPGLPPPQLPRLGLLSTLLDLLAYCAVVGLAHSVHFYRRFREREHQALFLESNLAQARLKALRAQLQPHFLFNSLNAIAALLRRDPRLAEATLLSLSELLRLALSQSERQEVSLREEMNLVQHYLEIQQTRFGAKLRIEQEIEPATLDCLVPTLLLQPLIENAIRHGIEPADNTGLVRVTAHPRDGRLVLTVEDDGVGLSHNAVETANTLGAPGNTTTLPVATSPRLGFPGPRGGNGIGLTNLRARLETLYGTQQKLELAARPEGGAAVSIEIPWRTVPATETSSAFRQP
jgi:two-component sensor histidine kinase